MAFRGRLSILFVPLVVLVTAVGFSADPPDTGRDDQNVASQPDQSLDMSAWSVDSGGGESSGGDFSLIAAVGQPDVGQLTGNGTVLNGGLWAGVFDPQPLFDDGFEGGDTGAWDSTVGGTK